MTNARTSFKNPTSWSANEMPVRKYRDATKAHLETTQEASGENPRSGLQSQTEGPMPVLSHTYNTKQEKKSKITKTDGIFLQSQKWRKRMVPSGSALPL